MAKPGKHVLEVITWLDHAGPASAPDHSPKSMRLVKRVSVGWVVYEDEQRVVYAGCLDENGCHDMTVLGKALVTKRERVCTLGTIRH